MNLDLCIIKDGNRFRICGPYWLNYNLSTTYSKKEDANQVVHALITVYNRGKIDVQNQIKEALNIEED